MVTLMQHDTIIEASSITGIGAHHTCFGPASPGSVFRKNTEAPYRLMQSRGVLLRILIVDRDEAQGETGH